MTPSYILKVPQDSFCCKCKKVTDDTEHTYLRTQNDRLRKQTSCKCCKGNKSTFISQKEGGALTEDEKQEANRWSRVAASSYEKPEERLDYLRKAGIDDLDLDSDNEFQNPNTAVYKDKKGKRIVSFRGTNIKDKHDLLADAAIVRGTFDRSKRYKDWSNIMDAVVKKHGVDNIDRTVGHSLGGRASLELAKKHNLKSDNFNPGSAPVDVPSNLTKKLSCAIGIGSDCGLYKKNRNWIIHGDPVNTSMAISPFTNRFVYPRQANPHALSNWQYP